MKYKKLRKRKYTINEFYFSKWSHDMAYILGFIMADGCIQHPDYKLTKCGKQVDISKIGQLLYNGNFCLRRKYNIFLESGLI